VDKDGIIDNAGFAGQTYDAWTVTSARCKYTLLSHSMVDVFFIFSAVHILLMVLWSWHIDWSLRMARNMKILFKKSCEMVLFCSVTRSDCYLASFLVNTIIITAVPVGTKTV
jgi:hypothetical protein